jgi:hypothetical protein
LYENDELVVNVIPAGCVIQAGIPPYFWRNIAMKKLILIAASLFFTAGISFAQAPAPSPSSSSSSSASTSSPTAASQSSSCAAKAVDKNGKPLAGAAKASFMKKCEAGNKNMKAASCETKAVDKNGKPLAGAAKASFMKKCEAGAGK